MLFSFCFFIVILGVLSQNNSLGWTSSSLLDYVRSNINSINPNSTEYYFIDPDHFIQNTTEKESLLDLLSSIYEKYKIKIIFIVIKEMYPFFGYEQNIFDLAKNFTVVLFNNDTLLEYMTIAFSIEDDAQGVVLGKAVANNFTYGTINGYLYSIHSELEKKKYYSSFFSLLTYIKDKKVLPIYPLWLILSPLMIIGGICLIGFTFFGIIFGVMEILDDKKKAKSVQLQIKEFREKKKGKEIFDTVCVFCLQPFIEGQSVITDESNHSANTNDTSIRYENVEIVQSNSQQNEVNVCTHHMHIECCEQWKEMCGECCPLCKENVDMIENTDEGREKIYHVIWNVQRKKYCCLPCCFPFKKGDNKK